MDDLVLLEMTTILWSRILLWEAFYNGICLTVLVCRQVLLKPSVYLYYYSIKSSLSDYQCPPTPSTRCVLLPVVIQMLVLLFFPHINISILLILNFNDLLGTLPFIQIHLKCSRLDRGWFGCSVFWWNPACWGENRGWWFGDIELVQNQKERRR